jgi:hypothetical protein
MDWRASGSPAADRMRCVSPASWSSGRGPGGVPVILCEGTVAYVEKMVDVQTAIRYAGCSTRAPTARIAASARSPSPGCRSTARTRPPRMTVSNPSRTASSTVSFTQ